MALLLSGLLVSGCIKTDTTLTAAEFYEGKTINMVVSNDPGGFVDLISRNVANYLSADINGNVTVENMREAGGLEGMNYLFGADPDGLTLGTVSTVKFLSNKVLNDPAAIYNIEGFSYIMKVDAAQAYFFVSPDGPYQSIADLQTGSNLVVAGGSASGYVSLAGLTVIDLLDLNAKIITGFENDTARALATQRGEVIGYSTGILAAKSALDAGTLKPLFVIATQRDPAKPEVPALTELVDLSEEDIALLKLWENGLASGTLLLAPGEISEDKVDYLSSLAEKWCQQETFRQEINNISGYKVSLYFTGQALKELITQMAADLENFQTRFVEMIEKYRL